MTLLGGMVGNIVSVDAGQFLDIQPHADEEWVIHNIYHESDVQIEFYDGTNSLVFESCTGAGVYAKGAFHVKSTLRLRVKNTATSAKLIGYDGLRLR